MIAVRRGLVVALLGAESTGKTTLAMAMRDALIAEDGWPSDRVAIVGEYLREFCDQRARTPRHDEQAGIAAEQTTRIAAAAARHAIVIADTTALMTAVYHEQVFGDDGLYRQAEADHAQVDATLLVALDLPWVADGLQRDGPQVRRPVDAKLRAALDRIGRPYGIVYGSGPERTAAAMSSLRRMSAPRLDGPSSPEAAASADVRSHKGDTRIAPISCERCGDPTCERRLRLPRG